MRTMMPSARVAVFGICALVACGRGVGPSSLAGHEPVRGGDVYDPVAGGDADPSGPLGDPATFTLLYSTLGYELAASKRALLRSEAELPVGAVDVGRSRWKVTNQGGRTVASGRLEEVGVSYGVPLWAADFSAVRRAGAYTVSVTLGGDAAPAAPLVSEPFEVASRLHTDRTLIGVALHNAEARAAPVAMGGGLYDCNTKMGEAYSHGIFLAGLSKVWERRRASLSAADQGRLEAAVDRTLDYLLGLQDAVDHTFAHEHPARPGQEHNLGDHNTWDAAYGLAVYADIFASERPASTADVAQRVRRAVATLDERVVLEPSLDAAIHARLYRRDRRAVDWSRAADAVTAELDSVLAELPVSHPWRRVPAYEGLYVLAQTAPRSAEVAGWITRAEGVVDAVYAELLERQGFRVMPAGEARWGRLDEVPRGSGGKRHYANTHMATVAEELSYLQALTHREELERIATASLGWITGLNPGVAGEYAVDPPSEAPRVAASFLVHGGGRHAAPWTTWHWGPLPPQAMSIVNGFIIRGWDWAYYDQWESGETFIMHDGAWLGAIVVYEDLFAGALAIDGLGGPSE